MRTGSLHPKLREGQIRDGAAGDRKSWKFWSSLKRTVCSTGTSFPNASQFPLQIHFTTPTQTAWCEDKSSVKRAKCFDSLSLSFRDTPTIVLASHFPQLKVKNTA